MNYPNWLTAIGNHLARTGSRRCLCTPTGPHALIIHPDRLTKLLTMTWYRVSRTGWPNESFTLILSMTKWIECFSSRPTKLARTSSPRCLKVDHRPEPAQETANEDTIPSLPNTGISRISQDEGSCCFNSLHRLPSFLWHSCVCNRNHGRFQEPASSLYPSCKDTYSQEEEALTSAKKDKGRIT